MTLDMQALRAAVQMNDGDPEITAEWLAQHRDDVRLIDVREPHELTGPLGQVDGVQNVPLLALLGQARTLDEDEPLVLICRSGRRSALAANALRESGIKCVASVEGGMLAWNHDVLHKPAIIEDEKVANTQNLSEAIYTTNGLPEVSSQWVQNNLGRFRLIDVRETGELLQHGRVAQSEHVPLQRFLGNAHELDREAPMVVMCASGGRSGRAVRALQAAGFRAVASMEGGMFGWRAYGLPYA